MGTYNIGTQTIAQTLNDALDNLEGDFTDEQLQIALKIIQGYPHVSDKEKDEEKYYFDLYGVED